MLLVTINAQSGSGTQNHIVSSEHAVTYDNPTRTVEADPYYTVEVDNLNSGNNPAVGIYTFRDGNANPTNTTLLSALDGTFINTSNPDDLSALDNLRIGDVIEYTQGDVSFDMTVSTVPSSSNQAAAGGRFIGFAVSNVSGGTTYGDLDQSVDVEASFGVRRIGHGLPDTFGGQLHYGPTPTSLSLTDAAMREYFAKIGQIEKGLYVELLG